MTHVDTGALRASHRMQISGTRGRVFIDPNAVNRRGQKTAEYGRDEMERGGSHAFYRIARERAQAHLRNLVRQAEKELVR